MNMLDMMRGQQLSQVKRLLNLVRSSQNPQAMMYQMMQNNPQLKQAVEYINQNGGNPRDAFYALAKERGVDPNEILNMLK